MIKKLFQFLIHFIFVVFILALVIGVPAAWMVRRSYSAPEVHYFYMEQERADEAAEPEVEEPGTAVTEAAETDAAGTEGTESQEPESERTESLRFAVLSDLYGYVFEGGNGIIADLVSSTFPDAILIGGNMIDGGSDGISGITDLIRRLSQIAPVYYSYGEQELSYVNRLSAGDPDDRASDPLRAELKKAGAVVLNGEYTDVQLYGISARIGGMNDKAYELTNLNGKVKRKSSKAWNLMNRFRNTDRLKVMISNRTDNFLYGDACETWKTDLVVSGNELGGLVVLPYYGGVFGGSQGYFPEYIHGMYEKGKANLLITSGLSAPRGIIPRFNNPPEIAVLDIGGLMRAAK